MAVSFSSWEQEIINTPGYPNNNEERLAMQTLKVCITESPIANDEIAQNGYALFDYVMFCYFVFRAGLYEAFSWDFIESYDAHTQYLMSLYFNDIFNIPREKISELIVSRGKKYESLDGEENIAYKAISTLTQYIENDFNGTPNYEGWLITDIFDNFEIHMKLSEYIQATLPALEKQRAFILLCESKKAYTHATKTPTPTKQNKAQPVTEKKESPKKKEEQIQATPPPQTKRNNTNSTLRNDVMLVTAIIGIIATMFFVIFFDVEDVDSYKLLLVPLSFYCIEYFVIYFGFKWKFGGAYETRWVATLCFSPLIVWLFGSLGISYLFPSTDLFLSLLEWFSMIGVTISVLIFEYKFFTHGKKQRK